MNHGRHRWPQFISPFAIGLGADAALGVMFAPNSGEDTRKYLRDAVQDGADKAVSHGNTVMRRVKARLSMTPAFGQRSRGHGRWASARRATQLLARSPSLARGFPNNGSTNNSDGEGGDNGSALDDRDNPRDLVGVGLGNFLYLGWIRPFTARFGNRRGLDPSHSGPQTGLTIRKRWRVANRAGSQA
jgi:hypothetical protein